MSEYTKNTEIGSYVEYQGRLYEIVAKMMLGVQGHRLELRNCMTDHLSMHDFRDIMNDAKYKGSRQEPPEGGVPESTECMVAAAREYRLSLAMEN